MTNKLYCYYRISDAGNPLGRTELGGTFLSTLNRKKCFTNFLDAFGVENLKIFADNVTNETVDFIKSKNARDIIVTTLGNTVGFIYLIQYAIQKLEDDDILYIVEDDYLHTKDARQYIFEGIEVGDYVSLYDSLDKYQGTNNPLISGGGENTKVILGKTSHFKYTNATTGTFAAKIRTLKEDGNIIQKHCMPHFPHPRDFLLFRELIEKKGRKLVCPMPGKASHVGLELSPFVNWKKIVENLKE